MIKNKFTKFEIAEYLCGWLIENLQEDGSPSYWHSLDDIDCALSNAKSMLRDDQDGIAAGQKIKAKQRILHDD